MKKYILLSILVFFTSFALSQDTIRLKHTNYTSVFDTTKKYPVLVEWWVTKSMVTCEKPLKRKDNFKPDPLLPKETDLMKDYVGSGYDRGHMMPAADNLCQTQQIQDESFYFSNMSPQKHSLNAGDWKTLETLTREFAKNIDSIHVWAGNIGEIKKIKGLSIPKYCWKVVYFKQPNKFVAYLFKNDGSKPDGIDNNEVKLEKITELTGFKFR